MRLEELFPLVWKNPDTNIPEIRLRADSYSEVTAGLAKRSAFLISRTPSDKNMRPCWHTLSARLLLDSHLHCLISSHHASFPPTSPSSSSRPLPSLCCFVLSLGKIMKASTCKRVSIDVRIHNQQIQKHILGSKWKGGWRRGGSSSSQWN